VTDRPTVCLGPKTWMVLFGVASVKVIVPQI